MAIESSANIIEDLKLYRREVEPTENIRKTQKGKDAVKFLVSLPAPCKTVNRNLSFDNHLSEFVSDQDDAGKNLLKIAFSLFDFNGNAVHADAVAYLEA